MRQQLKPKNRNCDWRPWKKTIGKNWKAFGGLRSKTNELSLNSHSSYSYSLGCGYSCCGAMFRMLHSCRAPSSKAPRSRTLSLDASGLSYVQIRQLQLSQVNDYVDQVIELAPRVAKTSRCALGSRYCESVRWSSVRHTTLPCKP